MKNKLTFLAAAVILITGISAFVLRTPEAPAETSLKQVLVDQLKSTHTKKDWFVTINVAVEGLTPQQALWSDKSGNHSVAQLTYHLLFWNKRQLEKFNNVKSSEFSGNNEETFTGFDKMTWPVMVAGLDKVMTDLENTVAGATDAQLREWAPSIANISTHNAYHTGQIVYVRKLQGAWDAEKGVK